MTYAGLDEDITELTALLQQPDRGLGKIASQLSDIGPRFHHGLYQCEYTQYYDKTAESSYYVTILISNDLRQ